ncbi:MAG: sugar 3,4-ketoisomerase [Bacteroidota bacterium]
MSRPKTIYDCSIMQLPKVHNPAGNITAIENQITAPFDIERVYYLYDVPGGADRGGHAHKELQQFVIAVSGAFDIMLDDGVNKKIVHLDRPFIGLHIVPGIWRELLNFSSGAICLVLASHIYDAQDYIREYEEFITFKN